MDTQFYFFFLNAEEKIGKPLVLTAFIYHGYHRFVGVLIIIIISNNCNKNCAYATWLFELLNVHNTG